MASPNVGESIAVAEQYIILKLFMNCKITESNLTQAISLSGFRTPYLTPGSTIEHKDQFELRSHLIDIAIKVIDAFIKGKLVAFIHDIVLLEKPWVVGSVCPLLTALELDEKNGGQSPYRENKHAVFFRGLTLARLKECLEPFKAYIDVDAMIADPNRYHKQINWARYVCVELAASIFERCVNMKESDMRWDLVDVIYSGMKTRRNVENLAVSWAQVCELRVGRAEG